VTGDSLDTVGEQQVLFKMGNVNFNHSFLVCKLPTSADGIIGLNFLTPRHARLDLGSLSLRVRLNPNLDFAALSHEALLEECKRREERGLITHVSISQNPSRDRSVESGCIKSARKDNLKNFVEETPPKIKETNSKPHDIVLNDSEAWTVISKETVVLQPRAKYTVLRKVQGGSSRNTSCILCVEPANVPIEGICMARVLTRPSVGIHKNQPVRKRALSNCCTQLNVHSPDVPRDLKVTKQLDGKPEIRYPPDSVTLMIANFSDLQLSLPK
jgi:hypothetical protein